MAETESITVAEVSDGPCGNREPGQAVDLPVVELLTGRGFVTGKSGAGKSNTASVIVEKLLDNGFGMLIVDIDGEYYGLKEEYEILHVGADDECDIQVTVDHAEKIASLALEQNVPIILDMSSFLDEEEGKELLTAVSRQLFAKEKKQKQPFLMLVEEVHEWIPQKGSVGECGKMLIKISKRGRKHGLGIMGVSQRPADVKKDFITQCDWLVWHRLTWNNDTKVVRRVLDGDYAEAVEDLDDGEAFMMTDWFESVRRVQFQRKQTFDAGATPGLDDFERPDLKSVSDDLVSELSEISDEQREREDRIAELREELDAKNSRIAELETELQDARNMQRMAEQFTHALVEHVESTNPGRTEQERMRERRGWIEGDGVSEEPDREDDGYDQATITWPGGPGPERDGENWNGAADASAEGSESTPTADAGDSGSGGADGGFLADFDASAFADEGNSSEADAERADDTAANAPAATDGGSVTADVTRGFDGVEGNPLGDRATDAFERGTTALDGDSADDAAEFAGRLAEDIRDLDPVTRQMLRYYRDRGPGTPMDALFAAGGSNDRTSAYARNRRLRVRGVVEHVGRGRYGFSVPELIREGTDCDRVEPHLERVGRAIDSDTDDVESEDCGSENAGSRPDEPDDQANARREDTGRGDDAGAEADDATNDGIPVVDGSGSDGGSATRTTDNANVEFVD